MPANPTTYGVTVDTPSIADTAGSIDFQFNPGPSVTEDVSDGPLPIPVTFDNGTGFKDYFRVLVWLDPLVQRQFPRTSVEFS